MHLYRVILFAVAIAAGQQPSIPAHKVQGVVSDSKGAPFAKAHVTIRALDSGVIWSTESKDDGTFLIEEVPEGEYRLTVGAERFESQSRWILVSTDTQIAQLPIQPASERMDTSRLVDHLHVKAGARSRNCGLVGIKDSFFKSTDCGLKAFSSHQPFFLVYRLQGIDSEVSVGVAYAKSGEGYVALFDSMGFSTDDLGKDFVVSQGNHIITTPCPTPTAFRKNKSGRVTCFPEKHGSSSPAFWLEN